MCKSSAQCYPSIGMASTLSTPKSFFCIESKTPIIKMVRLCSFGGLGSRKCTIFVHGELVREPLGFPVTGRHTNSLSFLHSLTIYWAAALYSSTIMTILALADHPNRRCCSLSSVDTALVGLTWTPSTRELSRLRRRLRRVAASDRVSSSVSIRFDS